MAGSSDSAFPIDSKAMLSIPVNFTALIALLALLMLGKWWSSAAYYRDLQRRHNDDPNGGFNTFGQGVTANHDGHSLCIANPRVLRAHRVVRARDRALAGRIRG